MSEKKGTYYEIEQLSKRIDKLESTIREFMSKWGPEVQEKRDSRDEIWDEMVRVFQYKIKIKGSNEI